LENWKWADCLVETGAAAKSDCGDTSLGWVGGLDRLGHVAYIRRNAKPAVNQLRAYRSETLGRIGPLARYIGRLTHLDRSV